MIPVTTLCFMYSNINVKHPIPPWTTKPDSRSSSLLPLYYTSIPVYVDVNPCGRDLIIVLNSALVWWSPPRGSLPLLLDPKKVLQWPVCIIFPAADLESRACNCSSEFIRHPIQIEWQDVLNSPLINTGQYRVWTVLKGEILVSRPKVTSWFYKASRPDGQCQRLPHVPRRDVK